MTRAITGALAALALALAAGPGRANVILSLTTDKPLNSLPVGQPVTFSVNVQLTGVEILDSLEAEVRFPTGLFSLTPPTLATVGPIVINPAANFFPDAGPSHNNPPGFDEVGAFALDPGVQVINGSGLFFSFKATLLKPGSGTISFDPAATSASFASGVGTPTVILPGDLAFQSASVPEPASFLLWGAVAAGGLLAGRRAARRVLDTSQQGDRAGR